MGIDADALVGYGILLDGRAFQEDNIEDGKLFHYDEEEGLTYNWDVMDDKGFYIRTEPYSSAWTFVGIEFLNNTPEATIKNLEKVKEKYEEMLKELLEVIPKGDELGEEIQSQNPEIMFVSYFS